MKNVFLLIYLLLNSLFVTAQQVNIDLSTGRYDDGTLIPVDTNDSDWTIYKPDGTTISSITRQTYTGWSYADLGSGINSTWITTNGYYSNDYYYSIKSKSFTIPDGATNSVLNIRNLSFVRNWTSLVRANADGSETETQITATTWMSDGAKGWLNSRSPVVNNYPLASGTYYIKVKLYCNNVSVRPSIDVNANISYIPKQCVVPQPVVTLQQPTCNLPTGTISISPVDNASYSFDNGVSWQAANSISGISPGTYHVMLKVGDCMSQSYSAVINTANCKWTLAPNSYVFTGKDKAGNLVDGLYIPVKKAYAMWKDGMYMGGGSIPSGSITSDVLWEDNPGLIKSGDNYTLEFIGSGEDAKIKVPISTTKKGNAVVTFKVNGEIYWSWHIWATDDPTNGSSYKSYDGLKRELADGTIENIPDSEWGWMDRNLGAIGNSITTGNWNKNGGLLYQWGRKDPIPPLANKGDQFYEVLGSAGKIIHRSAHPQQNGYTTIDAFTKYIPLTTANIVDNLKLSVKNPLSLMYVNTDGASSQASYAVQNGTYYDVNWFGSVPGLQTFELSKVNLWSDNSKGIVDINTDQNYNDSVNAQPYRTKSSYDPCPNGWRVPSFLVSHATNNIRVDYSPYGVKTNTASSLIYSPIPGVSNIKPGISTLPSYLQGIKVYPQMGFDMSNVGGYDMGVFPGTGMIDRRDNSGQYSDGHETYLWTATMAMWDNNNLPWSVNARALRLIPDQTQIINNYRPDPTNYPNVYGLYSYIPMANLTTNKALGCRCIKDPLFIKNQYEFDTEFFNENVKYIEGLNNPNSYVLTMANTVTSLDIPISKAFSVQSQILNNSAILNSNNFNNLKANVLWSDKNDLVTSVNISNQNPTSLDQITNTTIKVTIAPNKSGNAVITLQNGDVSHPIYWSWHIWVTNTPISSTTHSTDTPITTDNYMNYTQYGTIMKTVFMDRNLGAIDAIPNVVNPLAPTATEMKTIDNSQGLQYQWGRKDPIPVFQNISGSLYNIYLGNTDTNGNVTYSSPISGSTYESTYPTTYSVYKSSTLVTDKIDTKIGKILKYSVENPLNFMQPDNAFPVATNAAYTNGTDWLFDADHGSLYPERWGSGTLKSVFDPCPNGWRIPDIIQNLANKKGSPWSLKDNSDNTSPATDASIYNGTAINTGKYGTTKGFIFNSSNYNVGDYPKGYIRGQRFVYDASSSTSTTYIPVNHTLSPYNSQSLGGYWYASLMTNLYGRGVYFGNDRFGRIQVLNNDIDPYAAMSCRCVKQENDDNTERGPIPSLPVTPNTGRRATNTYSKAEITEKSKKNILLFPNPVTDLININGDAGKDYYYQIYNMAGQKIVDGKFENNQVNLSSLLSGVYIVRINDSEKVIKILKK